MSAAIRSSRTMAFASAHGKLCRRHLTRQTRTACAASLPCLPLFYSDLYTYPLPSKHRFPMHKYEDVRKQLQAAPLMQNSTFTPSPLATRRELECAHCRDYVSRFLHGNLSTSEERTIGFPWTLAGVRRALGSTGGTVGALRAVMNGARISGQIAGGTHHARPASGAGYCVFNDLGVAAYEALRLGARQVVILDLDVHQGEGSAAMFAQERRVRTVSFHAQANFPFRKEQSDVDVGLDDGTTDDEYLACIREVVPRVIADADVALLQMGVDGLASDTLGRLSLTRQGLSHRNRFIYGELLRRGLRTVVTMGGGYARPIQDSVDAHCDVYTDAVRALMRY